MSNNTKKKAVLAAPTDLIEREYAVMRLNEIAEQAGSKLLPKPVHTNEVFTLVKKHKIAPMGRKEFFKGIREAAKNRTIDEYRLNGRTEGNVAAFRSDIYRLTDIRHAEVEVRRRTLRDKAAELGEKVMIEKSMTPRQAVLAMREFVRSQS